MSKGRESRAELRGNDREGFLLFLIQVEGAAQECSSGSESRHPDGRQMLENILEQHVRFSHFFPSQIYTNTLSGVHKRHFICTQTSPSTCPVDANGFRTQLLGDTSQLSTFNERLSRTRLPLIELHTTQEVPILS